MDMLAIKMTFTLLMSKNIMVPEMSQFIISFVSFKRTMFQNILKYLIN